jgi:hypothetical protein
MWLREPPFPTGSTLGLCARISRWLDIPSHFETACGQRAGKQDIPLHKPEADWSVYMVI